MKRAAYALVAALSVFAVVGFSATFATARMKAEVDEAPKEFAPFVYWMGGWKGSGIPTANRLKGWPEKHNWAWKFKKGRPIALTLTLQGSKILAKAELTFDEDAGVYHLRGTDPKGKEVAFVGKLDKTGKILALDREGQLSDGSKERLSFVTNSNGIRYTWWLDRREPRATRFARAIEVLMGKEGESFAGGDAGGANAPKCIITGGTATMTVSHDGKSYPICCTGCRDEFTDNPTKYIARFEKKNAGKPGDSKPRASSKGKDDDSFDGLVGEDEEKPAAKSKTAKKTKKDK